MSDKKHNSRSLTIKVKTAKGRKISSVNWLNRQLNDVYVQKARTDGYLSRAAYKLVEINDKFDLIRSSSIVIDIGAAPGGWTQVALEKVKKAKGGIVISIDINSMNPIGDAIIITHDFLADNINELINRHLGSTKANLIMSDMAAPSCGHPATDHIRIMALCEAAYLFAIENLAIDGNFIAKILKGGSEQNLLSELKKSFKIVKHFKPPASRKDSAESYIIGIGFRK